MTDLFDFLRSPRAVFCLMLMAGFDPLVARASVPHVGLAEVSSGQLLLKPEHAGRFRPAVTQSTDMQVAVTGPIARTVLRQQFHNPGSDWAEAVYAFPLPQDAAVDHLRLRIDDRVIEGEIQLKQQARKTYEQAKRAGQRTALVEQRRPNLFTTDVANIAPDSTIVVELEFQQSIAWQDRQFELRLPLGVTPRYQPATQELAQTTALGGGWAVLPGELDAIVQLGQADEGDTPINTVSIRVDLRPGFALDWVDSPSHAIRRQPLDAGTQVALESDKTAANKDFVLRWAPVASTQPQGGFFVETTAAGEHYALLTLMPPHRRLAQAHSLPREVIFVIDTSGSMGGQSIAAARQALQLAIKRLGPGDSFNVIEFDSDARALFSQPVAASLANRERATKWVARLRANGGTEMLGALQLALAQPGSDAWLRQVVFMTDGAVGNERQVLKAIEHGLGNRRLFTVGIGAAPNGYFMTEAAQVGRGSTINVATDSDVTRQMIELFTQLEQAAVVDLAIDLPVAAEVLPAQLPDLYAGQPLVAVMKLDALPETAEVSGQAGATAWRNRLDLTQLQQHSGVAVHWARQAIRGWERKSRLGAPPAEVQRAIETLALQHHLVSRFTSLVAVDKTPARSAEQAFKRQALELDKPAGWKPPGSARTQIATAHAPLAQGSTPSLLLMLIGVALLLLAGLFGSQPKLVRVSA